MLRGHFLDLDAALGAGHQDRQADGAVQHHADVDFAGDLGRRLDDQHLRYLLSLLAGLLGDERILEHDLGDLAGLGAGLDELDAAEVLAAALERALAAAAGVDLGLEHDRAAELVEGLHAPRPAMRRRCRAGTAAPAAASSSLA